MRATFTVQHKTQMLGTYTIQASSQQEALAAARRSLCEDGLGHYARGLYVSGTRWHVPPYDTRRCEKCNILLVPSERTTCRTCGIEKGGAQ